MAKYKTVYKCLLCGKVFTEPNDEEREIDYNDFSALFGKILTQQPHQQRSLSNSDINMPQLYLFHHCNDEDAGLASFVGFKKVQSKLELEEYLK